MKILITADLQGREGWYRWIATQQPELLVIAGNLVGDLGFDEKQNDFVIDALTKLEFPIAICSGFHDNPTLLERLRDLGVLVDGVTAENDGILVTCLPHRPLDGVDELILETSAPFRKGKQWLVVHHAPPSIKISDQDSPGQRILRQTRQYQPDYLACGHWHDPKYHKAWYSSVGNTKVFNPGYREIPGDAPNCTIIDTELRVATWLDRGSFKGGPSRVEQTRF